MADLLAKKGSDGGEVLLTWGDHDVHSSPMFFVYDVFLFWCPKGCFCSLVVFSVVGLLCFWLGSLCPRVVRFCCKVSLFVCHLACLAL